MANKNDFSPWVVSVQTGEVGYVYVKLYADAPQWVRHQIVNHFGKGTVFLHPEQRKPLAA